MAESTRGDRVAALFPTPVIFDDLDDSAGLNRQLEAAILARRDQDPGMRLSNRGGWQSRHDFPDWSGEAGSRLIKHATGLASTYTTSTVSDGVAPWIVDSWANVSESGSFNMAHVHGATFWSCDYYVALGDGEGGALILHDPRMPALRMHAPHYRYRDLGAEVAVDIKPKPGMMILFPGWLSHHVEPWRGTGMRISVAMNIRAVPAAHQFQATKSIGPFE